ncbi:SMP-30/gluconolactonase/LRE family protein [Actinoplanes sp. CA-142083]|uniref:SMP-30/gluconolactonase/LRE family protein n=1 Tax=Actinoplanes sp. CA-142083 TaxID=3239903 RepID=UPI003D8F35A2
MTVTFTATPVSPEAYTLGEGPVWDPVRERILWVDIVAGKVFAARLDPFEVIETWSFDGMVGAVAVSVEGELIVAERDTLTRVDPSGARVPLTRVLAEHCGSRLNDGAVDPFGRFLVGSLSLTDETGSRNELLVRLENGITTVLDGDLTLSNGLAWSPDGRTLYSIDSVPGIVHVRDYPIGKRRDLFRIEDGLPDGMCVDRDGNLWIAIWGRGRVEKRTPAGELLAVVETGATNTTSVTFVDDLLVITSATQGLDTVGSSDGRVLTARVDTAGLPTPYWNPVL